MTLILASIDDSEVWMVADTAVTGGPIDLRGREYCLKIQVSKDRNALIGFAGDIQTGGQATIAAAFESSHAAAIHMLASASQGTHVEFAYAYFLEGEPCLVHIENGNRKNVRTLHLGDHKAFDDFQKLRLGEADPYVPLALKTFMIGSKTRFNSKRIAPAIRCMIDLFAWRPNHDVGGWASPYILTTSRAYFCEYCYSVSDPIFDQIASGSTIPHGTAVSGGSSLSVTELGDLDGEIVYWLQLPGGAIYQRTLNGNTVHQLTGKPEDFKKKAFDVLGEPISLWLSEQSAGPVKKVSILHDDKTGRANAVISQHEHGLTFSVHNLETPFAGSFGMTEAADLPIKAVISTDRKSVSLSANGGATFPSLELQASDLERLIHELSKARADLLDQVPVNGPQSGQGVAAQIDPAWRTNQSPILDIPGIYLLLRHAGYGWLGFILPHHEARSLGEWLQDNSRSI